jgi:hypothetical protein
VSIGESIRRAGQWLAAPAPIAGGAAGLEPRTVVGELLSADAMATTPTVSGDVAQVADLPAEVALAFGVSLDSVTVTRKSAMSIPTISQGRDVIAGTIGTFPLSATAAAGTVPAPRAFLDCPDPRTTRQYTITWTIDSLMFYGIAWWLVRARDALGFPTDARLCPQGAVHIDPSTGQAYVDGRPVADNELIRFDGPHEGILAKNAEPIATALLLEQAARKYAKAEQPVALLKDMRPANVGNDLTDAEVAKLLSSWRDNRAKYGTGYLNRSLDYSQPQQWSAAELQLVEARRWSSTELARVMGLDAGAVNAPAASGMTYQNGVEQRRGRLDSAFRQYLEAIEARLSRPDVTPRGHVVRFDTAGWLLGDAAERVDTAVKASGGPVLDTDEARAMYLGLPPNAALSARNNQTPEVIP